MAVVEEQHLRRDHEEGEVRQRHDDGYRQKQNRRIFGAEDHRRVFAINGDESPNAYGVSEPSDLSGSSIGPIGPAAAIPPTTFADSPISLRKSRHLRSIRAQPRAE
ncbi:hypothetical protein [Nocardia terpenica]|uniref:Uncharacterized protein n=1 Tax=Nocardia terpenica TaxID=455432 RepID=A0A6G9ZCI2_9NOCA|nr:hypothetical protein [Nocardia terpenica]QIS22713.1 hypothetical protein F6W96_34590 [Nocardia terpenica]